METELKEETIRAKNNVWSLHEFLSHKIESIRFEVSALDSVVRRPYDDEGFDLAKWQLLTEKYRLIIDATERLQEEIFSTNSSLKDE